MVDRIPSITATGSGAANGYFTVTSNSGSNAGLYPGATGWLRKSDNSLNQLVQVTELNGTDKVGLKFLPEDMDDVKLRQGTVLFPCYGRTDVSAYSAGSLLTLDAQTVAVNQDGTRLSTIYS